MPFTPLHAGPGLLAKAVLGRRFSFVAFGAAQVAMDIEPLLKLTGVLDGRVHGITHTWPGAAVIGLMLYAIWLSSHRLPVELFAEIRFMPAPVAFWSILFGVVSHLVLDAWMHSDMNIALVSALPALPNPDDPGNPIAVSEYLTIFCFMLAPIAYIFRRTTRTT